MRVSSISVLYKKEMLDMVRDQRTLVSMVLVPLLSMPIMFWVMNRFVLSSGKQVETEASSVAVRAPDTLPGLLNALVGFGLQPVETADVRAAVERKQAAAGVEPVTGPDGVPEVRIYADLTRRSAQIASNKIRMALDSFKEVSLRVKLIQLGLPASAGTPFTVRTVNLAPPEKMAGSFWGAILGCTVVMFMFSGAMYVAIDTAAGEKERRTLEVLLSAPAGRDSVIFAKLLAVTTAVVITAVLSIVSMLFSFRLLQDPSSGEQFGGRLSLEWPQALMAIATLLPVAVLAASVMLAISLFAKGYKEAQSYLTPVIMLSIFPLVVVFTPFQFTITMALVPLFNASQAIKQIFLNETDMAAYAITMLSNLVYAAIAFVAAVRIFRDERVLFRT